MSNLKSNNLAARMGRWSAYHWKTATFGWLGFVLVVFALVEIVKLVESEGIGRHWPPLD